MRSYKAKPHEAWFLPTGEMSICFRVDAASGEGFTKEQIEQMLADTGVQFQDETAQALISLSAADNDWQAKISTAGIQIQIGDARLLEPPHLVAVVNKGQTLGPTELPNDSTRWFIELTFVFPGAHEEA